MMRFFRGHRLINELFLINSHTERFAINFWLYSRTLPQCKYKVHTVYCIKWVLRNNVGKIQGNRNLYPFQSLCWSVGQHGIIFYVFVWNDQAIYLNFKSIRLISYCLSFMTNLFHILHPETKLLHHAWFKSFSNIRSKLFKSVCMRIFRTTEWLSKVSEAESPGNTGHNMSFG